MNQHIWVQLQRIQQELRPQKFVTFGSVVMATLEEAVRSGGEMSVLCL